MRVAVVLSDGHADGVDPVRALAADVELVAAARGRFAGITLRHGWSTAPGWRPQALTTAAYLAAFADPLAATVVALPLGVLNPVELAEQLATVDHAWSGRFRAGLTVASRADCLAHGVPPTRAAGRFTDGLRVLRAMWAGAPFTGEGPEFRFGEVRPTLRPVRSAGPPLSVWVADVSEARTAARRALGVRLAHIAVPADRLLVDGYRAAGGSGEVAVELAWSEATTSVLRELAVGGVDQVDVRIREPGDEQSAVLSTMDELAARSAVVAPV